MNENNKEAHEAQEINGMNNTPEVKLTPLGGMGKVSQNMFAYECGDEILIVDCGLGFPDTAMPGVDILIPDVSYLQDAVSDHGKKIVGMILSHGHDDHIGALPYILPMLPEFPIYASALTAGFAQNRIRDGVAQREVITWQDKMPLQLGENFSVRLFAMTHSVPDTKHMIIKTPVGNFYHGSDFKLDKTPVDNVLPDYDFIKQVSQEEGIKCLLMDCLRVERPDWGASESTIGPELKRLMSETRGKYIITLMSSHIHRIQQVVNAASELGRKVTFVGRSVEQNVRVALELGKLHIPDGMMIEKSKTVNYPDDKLVIIIAGSQGQEGSSLMRAIGGTHPEIQIKPEDMVVFSADAIPGNELNYYGAIDDLYFNGVKTIYPTIDHGIHQSGHASAAEQQYLLDLVRPEMVMPIGGSNRHRVLFKEFVAEAVKYDPAQVLLPDEGEIIGFEAGNSEIGNGVRLVDRILLRPQYVDGLGIGDVGPAVLNDRQVLSQAGMIIVILKRVGGKIDLREITVVSRGFVFMRDAAEVVDYIKKRSAELVESNLGKKNDAELEHAVERGLGKSLYKIIEREPMIEVEIVDFEKGGGIRGRGEAKSGKEKRDSKGWRKKK